MKAIVWTKYGSPDLLQFGQIEKPVPRDDEVLVKVYAATVTPGDCEIRRFDMHVLFWLPLRLYMGVFKPKRPVLGMEMAGEIEAVGKDVVNFKRGDKIMAGTGLKFGSYAEYNCIKASAFIAQKPDNMSFNEAATLPTGANNALHYVRKCNIKAGQNVLIVGAAGCFGTYAVQFAKLFGAKVTAVDSTHKLDTLLSIGVDAVIDYTKEDFTKNGQLYDAILDIAGKNSVSRNMNALKKGGQYVLATPWVKQVIQGTWTAKINKKKFNFSLAKEDPKELIYIKNLVEEGNLKAVIDRTYSLDQMAAAHHFVEKGEKIGHVSIAVTR